MACNCKIKIEVEEKYGTEVEETLYEKVFRFAMRFGMMIIAIIISLIVIPIMVVLSFYKVFFGDNKITLPNFLRKYMKE